MTAPAPKMSEGAHHSDPQRDDDATAGVSPAAAPSADYELHKRALAACLAAEPHLDADEDMPCTRHIADAARSLAIPARRVGRSTAPPRFDTDGEWDANGWERVSTWERKPGRI